MNITEYINKQEGVYKQILTLIAVTLAPYVWVATLVAVLAVPMTLIILLQMLLGAA